MRQNQAPDCFVMQRSPEIREWVSRLFRLRCPQRIQLNDAATVGSHARIRVILIEDSLEVSKRGIQDDTMFGAELNPLQMMLSQSLRTRPPALSVLTLNGTR